MDIYIWVGLIVLFLVIEGLTYQLVSIWFALGALVSLIVSSFCDNTVVQIVVFVISSVVALALTRPVAKKVISAHELKTNTESQIGKRAVVIEEVNNLAGTGRIKLSGIDWAAVSADDTIIPKDATVSILDIKGVKCIVEKVED